MIQEGTIHIGTSGWNYKHWKGPFYPEDLKASEELRYYAKVFRTVEINNSFYRLPSTKIFSGWREETPSDFTFSIKANRFITHMKKLKVDKQTIEKLITQTEALKEKSGPILFQLPPKWKINVERLSSFLQKLPVNHRYTFEFRDHTWYENAVYQLLGQYNCAFCIYELDGHLSPLEITSDFVYIRLHGPGKKYEGKYSDNSLKKWARKILKWIKERKDVYMYFDNDQAGYAAIDAARLFRLVNKVRLVEK